LKRRILIVEDDEIIQLDLRLHLQELQYTVIGAVSSGEEAVAKAAELQLDLVLMDIRLRGQLDGIEAARQIQSAQKVPIVYLTAQSGDQLRRNRVEIPEPRITKPFNQTVLQATIERALGKTQG
jgi:CheY-like chemotaxis protein